ncbi:MAG TPA: inorganic diphosphatase [Sandaracinaceae bacterium LLY-WYZ-13_1]|nr:inorganic diphosphatase [Sandaracinaceae bacterium LLY-WYZ-13_1]
MTSALPRLGDELDVVIEVPRLSFVKRRPDGAVHFVSPLPTPFNYGSVVGTLGADGDPLDVLLLGPRLRRGTRRRARVLGIVDFEDGGLPDPKIVVGEALSPWDRARVTAFFRVYARAKRWLDRAGGGAAYRGWIR